MPGNITFSRWFVREEIDLMQQCLEAVLSERFIDAEEVSTVTCWYMDEYRALLERFDMVRYAECALNEEDFQKIFQSVLCLSGFPVDRPLELESLLGMPRLHLSWFIYRMEPVRTEWEKHVQNDAEQSRRASTLPLDWSPPNRKP